MSQLPENGPRTVTEQASDWWVLLNSEAATDEDHRAFGEWVARSPERVEAFLQTASITKALKSKELRWPDTSVEELAREVRAAGDVVQLRTAVSLEPTGAPTKNKGRSRPAWLLATAASIAGVICVTWFTMNRTPHYETALGEQRSVVLEDGSVVTLNTASRIDVDFEESRRTIHLTAGEALFQVAHNPARPFDVIAGGTRVRAVGTQFNVDKRAEGTTVTVVEGKVAVLSESAAIEVLPTNDVTNTNGTTYLIAGQKLTLAAVVKPEVSVPTPANVASATAWTQRRLVFDRRSLGEVAEEFNRYNRQAIRIDSPQLRAQEVTGVFQANDPDSFLEFVAKVPGVKIERDADTIKVSDAP
ncbi:FecR family protein [Steroidobacter sp.]|uniref:FecR family protein n=1 Tax=Steroidobacter sp. TaxID=1978227 RepID=UPI001A52CD19|nr:FecR family protein [Steroidobacter sp.]MBL8268873.1 FecR family protein [Steroidobacter sp.]